MSACLQTHGFNLSTIIMELDLLLGLREKSISDVLAVIPVSIPQLFIIWIIIC